jgi:hypothetical protein
MNNDQLSSPNTIEVIQRTLVEPLGPGELGVLMASAGIGKTACLTHIALENLLRGIPVLHVSIDGSPDKIKVWYYELVKSVLMAHPEEDFLAIQNKIEPLRFILAYLHQTFSPAKLEKSLEDLRSQAKFQPSVVILDGLDFDKASRATLEEIKNFARNNGVSVWMSARTHRHISLINDRGIPYPCHESDELFSVILMLEGAVEAIQVKVLKHYDQYMPEPSGVFLDSETFLLKR